MRDVQCAGDIGPKFGYNGVDNGFLRFDHVLVPRAAMLAKYSKVCLTAMCCICVRMCASGAACVLQRADLGR